MDTRRVQLPVRSAALMLIESRIIIPIESLELILSFLFRDFKCHYSFHYRDKYNQKYQPHVMSYCYI